MRKYLFLSIFVLPLAGAALGHLAGPFVARAHRDVRLAGQVWREEAAGVQGLNRDTEAFWDSDRTPAELYQAAGRTEGKLRRGSMLLGGWFGLVAGVAMFAYSGRSDRQEYEIDHARCVACTRCYMACPMEHQRRRDLGICRRGEPDCPLERDRRKAAG